MKNSDKKTIGKNVLNGSLSLLKGFVSGLNPIVGAVVGAGEGVVKSIQKEKSANLNSEIGGVGNTDKARLIGFVGGIIIVFGGGIAVATGHLTMEEVKDIAKLFKDIIESML